MTRHYGCYNRPPLRRALVVQDGYHESAKPADAPIKVPRYVVTPHNQMSETCQYSVSTPDPRCCGCRWNQQESAARATESVQ